MIDESLVYYIGSWRRSPFDPHMLPQALNVDERSGSLRLANLDSEFNNLWKFNFLSSEMFVLELTNPSPAIRKQFPHGEVFFVSKTIGLTDKQDSALPFSIEPCEPFRKGPLDIGMLLLTRDGSALVSNEKTGRVMVADLAEAEAKIDKEGNFVMNIAWEATPDVDEAVQGSLEDVPDWLHNILTV
jgi:hypothetical protein